MNRRRFSPATAALVVILVGALYMVGKAVNPPPPGPPEQPKSTPETAAKPPPPQPSQSVMSARQVADRMKAEVWQSNVQKAREKYTLELNHGKPLPKTDDITPVYFSEHPMGAKGVSAVDAEAVRIKEIQDKVNKRFSGLKPPKAGEAMPQLSAQPSAPDMQKSPTPINQQPK